ncbi:STAS domain-containing protein [Mucilaginibacter sp. Bleaf8]|uniref:STAS domain-containing protein n=1 Tax=Mucilaginibacter sp. Bleaf8 TaxID=2834430 RepID=UPI001BCCCD05|nr:STAS domain-containing protein [Mucilaginibacter sp. Bleaf8]MBS7566250.1 STAS domain-containing protein [Mucilaginibacter sp. Bleaf8]
MMIYIVKEDKYLQVDVNLTEANLNNANEFKTQIISLLDQKKKSIVLNLAQVQYIDSSFLGAIVAALKHAISMQLDVILVGLQPDIHNLVKLIRLDKVFKIYNDYSEVL